MKRLIILLLAAVPLAVTAANRFSVATGSWNNNARWSTACGGAAGSSFPVAADDVFICNGTTIDITAAQAARSVTIQNGGTLRYNSTTARTLTVGSGAGTGHVTVNLGGTFTINNVNQNGHVLRLDGNLTNNGTFNMAIDGNSRAIVEFNRNGNQTISGTGATTNFQQIRLNMTSGANVVNATGLSNMTFTNGANPSFTATGGGGTFTLTSGISVLLTATTTIPNTVTLRANGGQYSLTTSLTINAGGTLLVDANAPGPAPGFTTTGNLIVAGTYDMTAGSTTVTGNLTVNNGGQATVNGGTLTVNGGTGVTVNTGGTFRVNNGSVTIGDEIIIAGGTVRIDNGTVNVGNAANEAVILQNAGAATFQMNGGALNCGRFTSNNATGGTLFDMTNGTLTVGVLTNTTNTAQGAPFYIGSGTQFNMSNGTIVIQSDNTAATAREYDVNATSSNVTGGTVQVGNASTAGGEVFQINSVPPLPNFTINAINNPLVTMISSVSLVGNWTKDSTGTFTPGANTVTMSGGAAQTIGGTQSTTFNNLDIANTSGGVSLTQNQTVGTAGVGTLTLTSGALAVGANTLTLNGPAIAGTSTNLSTTSSSSLTFGGNAAGVFLPSSVANLSNLTVNNVNGLTLNGSVALAGTPGLTLTSGPVFTGSNTITASVNCPAGVSRTAGHVSGNLRIALGAGTPNCTFHLGDGTNYSPLALNFSSVTTPGALTAMAAITPVQLDHPNTTAGTSGITSGTSVNRYWSLKDSAVAGTFTATFSYLLADNDAPGSAGSYAIRRGSGCGGTGSTRTCQPWLPLTVSGVPNTTTAVASPVSIAVGAGAEFDMSIGVLDPAINFQRERQFIYTREQY